MKNKFEYTIEDCQVNFQPTNKQVGEIEKWLFAEDQKTGKGFYCKLEYIKSSFKDNRLVTICLNNKSIGFATWRLPKEEDKIAELEIVEIRPFYRNKGIGKIFISELIKFFQNKNIFVIQLESISINSELFWKSCGFLEFPSLKNNSIFNSNENKKLYKILKDYMQPSYELKNDETIELWNDEPYRIKELTPPTYIWNLEFIEETRKLIKPIIQCAYYDWRIRWEKNGNTIKDHQIRYFSSEIGFNNFIIIEEL